MCNKFFLVGKPYFSVENTLVGVFSIENRTLLSYLRSNNQPDII